MLDESSESEEKKGEPGKPDRDMWGEFLNIQPEFVEIGNEHVGATD